MGRTKRACHLHPILGAWDAVVITCTPVRFLSTWGVVMLGKKKKALYITTISNIMHTILKVVNACQGNTNGVKWQVLTGKCHTELGQDTSVANYWNGWFILPVYFAVIIMFHIMSMLLQFYL